LDPKRNPFYKFARSRNGFFAKWISWTGLLLGLPSPFLGILHAEINEFPFFYFTAQVISKSPYISYKMYKIQYLYKFDVRIDSLFICVLSTSPFTVNPNTSSRFRRRTEVLIRMLRIYKQKVVQVK